MMKERLYIVLVVLFAVSACYAQEVNSPALSMDTLEIQTPADSLAQDSLKVSADTLKNEAKQDSSSIGGKLKKAVEKVQPLKLLSKGSEEAFDLKNIKEINFISIIRAAIILIGSFFIIIILEFLLKKFFFKKKRKGTIPLIAVIKFIIWGGAVYLTVNTLFRTSQIAGFIITLCAVIIFGTAALPLLRNILAGFYLFTKLPFQKGDFISIRDFYGEVQDIGWRTTKVLSSEGAVVNIPNSVFLAEPFENINIGQKEQLVTIDFSFPANFNVNEIMTILKEAALSSPYSYSKKTPHVFLESADYLNNINKFKLTLYLFDSRLENSLISSVNEKVFNQIQILKENILRGDDQ